MTSSAARVLFVHPYNHPLDDVIPVGSIAAMNLLAARGVRGRYAAEVTGDDLRGAGVVALDVHWFPPLAVLDGLLADLRRVRPDVPVVAGGITAAFYGRAFLERFDVDWVVGGDVELTLPTLVEQLLQGRTPPPLPGVWSRWADPPSGPAPRLSPGRFDRLDSLTVDWFPSLRKRVVERHELHRRGRQVPSDPGFPTLVVTRGCRRGCGFCHGATQQRLFGPDVLCRTAEGLLRDLQRLSRDPDIAFVTVFFGDGSVVERTAGAVKDAALDLDGFLFYCGSASQESLHSWRSAFGGEVAFSVIQPSDLAARPGCPSHPPAALEQLPDDLPDGLRAAIYHVSDPEPAALQAAQSCERIELASARDWTLVRPDASTAADTVARARQLEDVIEASRSLAAYNLLIALVPDLVRHGLPAAIELPSLERRLARASDPFVRRLLEALVRQVVERGIYGLEELRLGWSVGEGGPDAGARWTRPGEAGRGPVRWQPVLRGFAWEGEVEVPPGRSCLVAPRPRVRVGDREFDAADWPHASLPALSLAPGSARVVRVGGVERGGALTLWCEDRAERVEHRLPPPTGSP